MFLRIVEVNHMKKTLRSICFLLAFITASGLLSASSKYEYSGQSENIPGYQAVSSVKSTKKKKAAPLSKASVSTAMKKRTFGFDGEKVTNRIPKVSIKGVDTTAINKKIKKEWMDYYQDLNVDYRYYIGNKTITIMIDYGSPDGGGGGWVYNISRKTGNELNRSQMLEKLGISSKEFNSRVKIKIKKWLKGSYKPSSKVYKKTVSNKTLNTTMPYLNTKGKLCFITSITDPLDGYGVDHISDTC